MKRHRLSKIERGFWLGALVGGTPNNLSFSFLLGRNIDMGCLKKAIGLLVAENPFYYSHIVVESDGEPCWEIPDIPTHVHIDEQTLPSGEAAVLNANIDSYSRQPFDLTKEPPCRFRLFTWPEGACFIVVFHHAVSEGDSVELFCQRLSELYDTLLNGEEPQRRESNIFDYIDYEARLYTQHSLQDDKDYWNEYVKRHKGGLVASFFPEVLAAGHICEHHFAVDGRLVAEACKRLSVSPFRLMAVVWAVSVMKVCGIDGVYLNYTVSLRPSELGTTLGAFINNLLLYVDGADNKPFTRLLAALSNDRRQARQRQYLSMLDTDVHTVLRSTIAHVGFNYPLRRKHYALTLGGEHIPLYREPLTYLPSGLQLDVEEDLSKAILYSDASYPEFYGPMLAETFNVVLAQVAEDPEQPLADIRLTSPSQPSFNTPILPADVDSEVSLADMFRQVAMTHAQQPACYFGDRCITYQQLDNWSDNVASRIQAEHLTSDFIGVYCSRSIYTLALLIGVWKAGHAYIPLDPNYSVQRLQYIVDDCSPALILTDTPHVPVSNCPLLVMGGDVVEGEWQRPSGEKPVRQKYAYMIYTSGTTGHPKGTPITQRSLANLIMARQQYIPAKENSLELSFASISFDASVWDTYPPLFTGTPVYMASDDERRDPAMLLRLLAERRVSSACIPPALLTWMPYEELPSLRFLVVAGESCPKEVIQKWQQTTTVINAYGPTENTVCTTMHVYTDNDITNNIGKALKHVSCYVLNEQLHELPVGVKGQLFIGGLQLTEGYYHRPELNAEKFVNNPYVTEEERAQGINQTIYASGDLVYRLPDGSIMFCGRIDSQVKLNGFRIELDEVAHILEACDGVDAAVADVVDNRQGQRRLVAWVTSNGRHIDTTTLKVTLEAKLPSYMVPSALLVVDKFPLTSNGKIDRNALKQLPDGTPMTAEKTVEIQLTEQQKTIARLWQEVVACDSALAPDTHFFSIGGDSLAVVALAQRLSETFSVSVTVSQLYQHLELGSMSQFISTLQLPHEQRETVPPIPPSEENNGAATFPSGERRGDSFFPPNLQGLLMASMQSPKQSEVYHVVAMVDIPPMCSETEVLTSWNQLLAQQDALRLCFPIDASGHPYLHIIPYQPVEHIQVLNMADRQQRDDHIRQLLRKPFPLQDGPLYRIYLYRQGGEQNLVIIMHHLVTDGWSVSVLKSQLETLLRHLPVPRHLSYADYLADYAYEQKLNMTSCQQFWREHLNGINNLRLFTPAIDEGNACSQETIIGKEAAERLAVFCDEQKLTLFSALMAAYTATLASVARQSNFVVGYPSAGRINVLFNDTLGYLVHVVACPCPRLTVGDTYAAWCHAVLGHVVEEQLNLLGLGELIALAGRQVYQNAQSPLVQAFLTMEDDIAENKFISNDIVQFPLVLRVVRHEGGWLTCHWTYNPGSISTSTVRQLSECFQQVVEKLELPSGVLPSALPIPSKGETNGDASSPSGETEKGLFIPPQEGLEGDAFSSLTSIVADVIGCDKGSITACANLFTDLGLTSTGVMEMVWRASKQNFHFTVSDVYAMPTIAQLLTITDKKRHWWHAPYRIGLPTVLLVCGYSHAIPFYTDYADALSRRYNVYVFESFSTYFDDRSIVKDYAMAYVDDMEQVVRRELLQQQIMPFAVTGHSMGAELGLMLAERLKDELPDIRMVAVGMSVVTPHIPLSVFLTTLPETDVQAINDFSCSHAHLHFDGKLSMAVETKPSNSLVPGGQPIDGMEELSASYLRDNLEAIRKEYPDATVLLLDTDHFSMLQPQYLPDIVELFSTE